MFVCPSPAWPAKGSVLLNIYTRKQTQIREFRATKSETNKFVIGAASLLLTSVTDLHVEEHTAEMRARCACSNGCGTLFCE